MSNESAAPVQRELLEQVNILFSGDSGDGIQTIGSKLAYVSSVAGNEISCFPDFPAEIRAPAGTIAGVSGFKLCFASQSISAPGDNLNALVVMNPAALKHSLGELSENGLLLVNSDSFKDKDWIKAGYKEDPLESGILSRFRVIKVPMVTLVLKSLEETDIPRKQALTCKNMFALGIVCWLYERNIDVISDWLKEKFKRDETLATAAKLALLAGYHYADTVELFSAGYQVPKAALKEGKYRHITGNEALALGAVMASIKSKKELFFASYPITPSSDVLHQLSQYHDIGVKTFQSEDEIAAMSSAIGAAFSGRLALTSTSGPGLDLKQEAIGLAMIVELPVVIFNIQRAGPSTGMPTKTEQSDLLASVFGRHGDCTLPVLAAATPSDCFHMAIQAFEIATKFMTPVILLSDGYLANSAESWLIPSTAEIPDFNLDNFENHSKSQLFERNPKTNARPWIVPGTANLEHRIGGLEKDFTTGTISYEPDNHAKMSDMRLQKVKSIKHFLPKIERAEFPGGDLLVVGWGSTYGALNAAVEKLKASGVSIDLLHIKYISPLQAEVESICRSYRKVLVCELNQGQLKMILKSELDLKVDSLNKVEGLPFKVDEVYRACLAVINENDNHNHIV